METGPEKKTRRKSTEPSRRDGAATRQKLLETAERLFAQRGFEGVSVRDITAESRLYIGLVNYHFRSTENLFRQVLAMRVAELNQQRRELLDKVVVRPNDPDSVATLIRAFLQPYAGLTPAASRRLSNYRKLLALAVNSRRWQAEVIEEHFSVSARHLAQRLQEALPGADQSQIFWSLDFLLGAMVNGYAETGRIERLSQHKASSEDPHTVQEELVRYVTGGLLRLTARQQRSG